MVRPLAVEISRRLVTLRDGPSLPTSLEARSIGWMQHRGATIITTVALETSLSAFVPNGLFRVVDSKPRFRDCGQVNALPRVGETKRVTLLQCLRLKSRLPHFLCDLCITPIPLARVRIY